MFLLFLQMLENQESIPQLTMHKTCGKDEFLPLHTLNQMVKKSRLQMKESDFWGELSCYYATRSIAMPGRTESTHDVSASMLPCIRFS